MILDDDDIVINNSYEHFKDNIINWLAHNVIFHKPKDPQIQYLSHLGRSTDVFEKGCPDITIPDANAKAARYVTVFKDNGHLNIYTSIEIFDDIPDFIHLDNVKGAVIVGKYWRGELYNKVKSLKNFPIKCESFICSHNKEITSLKGIPEKCKTIYLQNNPQLSDINALNKNKILEKLVMTDNNIEMDITDIKDFFKMHKKLQILKLTEYTYKTEQQDEFHLGYKIHSHDVEHHRAEFFSTKK